VTDRDEFAASVDGGGVPLLWLVRTSGAPINTQLVFASLAEAEAYAACASGVEIIPLCNARRCEPPAAGVTPTDAEPASGVTRRRIIDERWPARGHGRGERAARRP